MTTIEAMVIHAQFAAIGLWALLLFMIVWYLPDILKAVIVLLKTQAAYNDRKLHDALDVPPHLHVPAYKHTDYRHRRVHDGSGCMCQRCSQKYKVDLIVPDDLWKRIKPEGEAVGAGMLCGRCIMDRIEAFNDYGSLHVSESNL